MALLRRLTGHDDYKESVIQKAAQNLPVHQGIPTLVLLTPDILCGAWPFFLSLDTEIGWLFCCTLESPLNRED